MDASESQADFFLPRVYQEELSGRSAMARADLLSCRVGDIKITARCLWAQHAVIPGSDVQKDAGDMGRSQSKPITSDHKFKSEL